MTHQHIVDKFKAAEDALAKRNFDLLLAIDAERKALQADFRRECGSVGHVVLPQLAAKLCVVCGAACAPAVPNPTTEPAAAGV